MQEIRISPRRSVIFTKLHNMAFISSDVNVAFWLPGGTGAAWGLPALCLTSARGLWSFSIHKEGEGRRRQLRANT